MQEPENIEGRFDEHIDETNLILYLDRELRPEDSSRVRSHLECCAECRQLEAELEQASVAFSSLQRDFDETLPAPPRNWAAFEQRLAGVLAEQPAQRESRWNVLRNAWRKWDSGAPILPWGLATAAAGLLVGYLLFHSPAYPTVSFSDIVNRVEQQRITAPSTLRPVIYRKLRISVSTAPNLPVTVELWKRTSDGRVKELEASQPAMGQGRQPTKQSPSSAGSAAIQNASDSGLLAQLNELYAANHLDCTEPISAAEFKRWTGSGDPKDERIVRESLPSGGEAYRLIARAKNPLNSPPRDFLSEMQLVVRSSDWHAIAERLTVQAPSGVRSYEVAELEYRELPLSGVPPSIFGATSPGTALAGDLPRAALGIQPLSGAALTLEVLNRLDAVDALVKDQVEVSRVGTEGLKLEGTIGSDKRKTEILAALGSLASNPAVELDLVSPSEARDLATRSASRPSHVQSIQVPLENNVSNAYLRNWLADHHGISGSQLDSEAERFQMEAVVLSTDAQLQAQALKHILAVVPAAPAEAEAAETWRRLVNNHAEAVQQQVQALEQHLAPVFRTAPAPRASDDWKPYNSEDLKEEADRLVDLVTASDHLLWQAFSRNSTDSDQHQLTEPKFWLMLEEEHFLAAHFKREAHP
jgi:hypothetical protein